MEKIEPKIYLKIGILLFGISFILTNCQKDDSILTSENKSLEQSKFKVKTLNSNGLKSHQKVIQKISKLNLKEKQTLQKSNNQRIIYNSELGFSINTDYVKY